MLALVLSRSNGRTVSKEFVRLDQVPGEFVNFKVQAQRVLKRSSTARSATISILEVKITARPEALATLLPLVSSPIGTRRPDLQYDPHARLIAGAGSSTGILERAPPPRRIRCQSRSWSADHSIDRIRRQEPHGSVSFAGYRAARTCNADLTAQRSRGEFVPHVDCRRTEFAGSCCNCLPATGACVATRSAGRLVVGASTTTTTAAGRYRYSSQFEGRIEQICCLDEDGTLLRDTRISVWRRCRATKTSSRTVRPAGGPTHAPGYAAPERFPDALPTCPATCYSPGSEDPLVRNSETIFKRRARRQAQRVDAVRAHPHRCRVYALCSLETQRFVRWREDLEMLVVLPGRLTRTRSSRYAHHGRRDRLGRSQRDWTMAVRGGSFGAKYAIVSVSTSNSADKLDPRPEVIKRVGTRSWPRHW